jgi:hypothetical protein
MNREKSVGLRRRGGRVRIVREEDFWRARRGRGRIFFIFF